MNDQDWEALFDKYITEVVDDEQEQIKSHMLPTAVIIRGLVSNSVTQAAANKAAEEGGLPVIATWQERRADWLKRNSQKREGPPSNDPFTQAEIKDLRAAIAADRASCQVANKAEVASVRTLDSLPDLMDEWVEAARGANALAVYAKIEALLDRHVADQVSAALATPPATTGASTARDQVLEEIAIWYSTDGWLLDEDDVPAEIRALKGSVGASTVLTDERIEELEAALEAGMNREIELEHRIHVLDHMLSGAAQAGQVAVPEDWKLVPVEPTLDMVTSGFESAPDEFFSPGEDWDTYAAMTGCQKAAYRAQLCYAAMLAAAPSPAEGTK